jgi:hypothetical protein
MLLIVFDPLLLKLQVHQVSPDDAAELEKAA